MADVNIATNKSGWIRKSWPFVRLPNKPAVYAIYFDGKLKCIGQSSNLSVRFSDHAKGIRFGSHCTIETRWGAFPDETNIEIKYHHGWRYGDWAMREIRLISRINPEFNIQHKRKPSNG